MVLKTNTKILKKCKNIVNKYNKRKRMLSSYMKLVSNLVCWDM